MWGIWVRSSISFEQLYEVFVGRIGIADMKLHRLTDAYQISNRNRAVVGFRPNHVGYQKVSPRETLLIFVHHDAQV